MLVNLDDNFLIWKGRIVINKVVNLGRLLWRFASFKSENISLKLSSGKRCPTTKKIMIIYKLLPERGRRGLEMTSRKLSDVPQV